MLRFVDVSNWQRGMDLAAVVRNGGLAGAIVKATEGVGYVDPACDGFVRQLREAGALFGYYHFARSNDAAAEAEFFRANTVGYEGAGIPVLDWEADQSVAWVNRFVERYHELTGVWPWVYANPWRFNQGTVNTNCGRWVAGYPSNGITDINYGINNDMPYKVNNGLVCAWQFSSSVRISGYSGNLDGDVFYGDKEAWMAYAGGGSGARLGFADAAAEVMEHLCAHSAHGYSQPNRAGVGTGGAVSETITLSDGTRVGISGGDRDCSSACIECYAALGVDCGGAWSTHDMERKMVASGNFVSLPRDTWRNPRRGDLLLAPGKHVAVALGGGRVAEAVRSENHSTHGALGDQDGGEIIIRGLYDDGWTCVLRYVGPEPEETSDEPATGETIDFGEEDEMNVIINVPKSDDMACSVMVWVCGDQVHDLANSEVVKYLQRVYAACHDGREMPVIEMSGSREVPEFQRFLQAVRGGIPDPSFFPAVDLLEARSEGRADGNSVVE